jgi:DNA-binding LacI/PurR family transcriptional regulator
MQTMRAPSLQDIADATGYSLMTVSRAIRSSGVVSDKARKAILKEAERIGYSYNPEITRMMSMMRSGHRDRYHETLAMLWFTNEANIAQNPSLRDFRCGAEERGDSLGYKVDMFYFDAYESKAARFCQALENRGIRGVILTPILQNERKVTQDLKMVWENFCWVAYGNSQVNQEFHRVGHHHYFGMELLMESLVERGYQRPALLISEKLDATVHRAYSGSFLAHHPKGVSAATKLLVPPDLPLDELGDWLRKKKADCLIAQHNPILRKALEKSSLRIPEDIGYASMHTFDDADVSGIDQRNKILGAHAVDMAVAQLHRNDLGLPDEPKLMLNKGVWVDNGTTRPQG